MKHKAMRNIQLSLWPAYERAITVEKLLGLYRRKTFQGRGAIRPARAEILTKGIKKEGEN